MACEREKSNCTGHTRNTVERLVGLHWLVVAVAVADGGSGGAGSGQSVAGGVLGALHRVRLALSFPRRGVGRHNGADRLCAHAKCQSSSYIITGVRHHFLLVQIFHKKNGAYPVTRSHSLGVLFDPFGHSSLPSRNTTDLQLDPTDPPPATLSNDRFLLHDPFPFLSTNKKRSHVTPMQSNTLSSLQLPFRRFPFSSLARCSHDRMTGGTRSPARRCRPLSAVPPYSRSLPALITRKATP